MTTKKNPYASNNFSLQRSLVVIGGAKKKSFLTFSISITVFIILNGVDFVIKEYISVLF